MEASESHRFNPLQDTRKWTLDLRVLKAHITQWAAQSAADIPWRQRQGDKCSCRRSYWLINHPVDRLWIANSLPWCVCCGNPGCSPEASEQQSVAEKDSKINECLLYVLPNHLMWLPWFISALKTQHEFLRHWSSKAAALEKHWKIWTNVLIIQILYIFWKSGFLAWMSVCTFVKLVS